MWWGKKKERAPVFVVNRRAAVLAFVILALAAWMAGGGAAMLSDDPYVQWVLVALSVVAVLYESVSLVLAQHAKARNDWPSVVWSRGLLVVAIFYTAGMQCTFLGPKLMKPRFDDQASAGAIAVLDQRIAALEERRKALPAVPGTPESFSWLIDQLEPDKSKAGQTKLRQAKSDMAVAKGVVALDKQIKDLNDERVKLLGRPPSDAKALLVSLVSNWDPQVVNLLWMILGVVFLQLTNVFMSRIRGLDYLQLAAAVPKPAKNDEPVSDKSGSNSGGSSQSGNETPGAKPSSGGSNVVKLPTQRAVPNAAVEIVSKAQDTGLEDRNGTDAKPALEHSHGRECSREWRDWDEGRLEPESDVLREVAADQVIVVKPSRGHRHGEGKKRQWTRDQLKRFMELHKGVPNGDALKKYCDEQRRKNRDGTFAISRSTAWRAINDHKRKHPHDAVEARLVIPISKRAPSTHPKLGRGLASLMGVKPQENGHANV